MCQTHIFYTQVFCQLHYGPTLIFGFYQCLISGVLFFEVGTKTDMWTEKPAKIAVQLVHKSSELVLKLAEQEELVYLVNLVLVHEPAEILTN